MRRLANSRNAREMRLRSRSRKVCSGYCSGAESNPDVRQNHPAATTVTAWLVGICDANIRVICDANQFNRALRQAANKRGSIGHGHTCLTNTTQQDQTSKQLGFLSMASSLRPQITSQSAPGNDSRRSSLVACWQDGSRSRRRGAHSSNVDITVQVPFVAPVAGQTRTRYPSVTALSTNKMTSEAITTTPKDKTASVNWNRLRRKCLSASAPR